MKIYAFSGLGTDGRIFKELRLNHELIPVKWIDPLPGESLPSYAIRLADQIDLSEPFALLGVSFGGMLVTEVSKVLKPEKIILISTATTRHELPWMAAVSRATNLHKILPARIYRPPVWAAYFGFPFNQVQRKIAQGIIQDMDHLFVKWALGAIVNWDNDQQPESMLHIHGRLDPILPYKKRMKAEPLGKGHFIILKEAKSISEKVNEFVVQ